MQTASFSRHCAPFSCRSVSCWAGSLSCRRKCPGGRTTSPSWTFRFTPLTRTSARSPRSWSSRGRRCWRSAAKPISRSGSDLRTANPPPLKGVAGHFSLYSQRFNLFPDGTWSLRMPLAQFDQCPHWKGPDRNALIRVVTLELVEWRELVIMYIRSDSFLLEGFYTTITAGPFYTHPKQDVFSFLFVRPHFCTAVGSSHSHANESFFISDLKHMQPINQKRTVHNSLPFVHLQHPLLFFLCFHFLLTCSQRKENQKVKVWRSWNLFWGIPKHWSCFCQGQYLMSTGSHRLLLARRPLSAWKAY